MGYTIRWLYSTLLHWQHYVRKNIPINAYVNAHSHARVTHIYSHSNWRHFNTKPTSCLYLFSIMMTVCFAVFLSSEKWHNAVFVAEVSTVGDKTLKLRIRKGLSVCEAVLQWKRRKDEIKTDRRKKSFEPDSNQRPKDDCSQVAGSYSPPLYQLSYRRRRAFPLHLIPLVGKGVHPHSINLLAVPVFVLSLAIGWSNPVRTKNQSPNTWYVNDRGNNRAFFIKPPTTSAENRQFSFPRKDQIPERGEKSEWPRVENTIFF